MLIATSVTVGPAGAAPPSPASQQAKIYAAFSALKSYRLTVLGSVRSQGVWLAPNRYEVTTDLNGQTDKTVIVGNNYWIKNGTHWDRSTLGGNSLDIDVANLLPAAKKEKKSLTFLPPETHDGKKLGTFSVPNATGTDERCNYDLRSYRITRCKSEDVLLLYSNWNDPSEFDRIHSVKIGITGPDERGEYARAIKDAGGESVALVDDVASIATVLEGLDGVLLSGGYDIDPTRYGRKRDHAETYVTERDEFEIALARELRKRQLPTLAICRGLQVINVAYGGTLFTDLPRDRHLDPSVHRPQRDGETVRSILPAHVVTMDDGILMNVLGRRFPTTSRHHQAIDRLASGFARRRPHRRQRDRSRGGDVQAPVLRGRAVASGDECRHAARHAEPQPLPGVRQGLARPKK